MKTTYCDKCNKSYRNCNFKKHKCEKKDSKFRIDEDWNIGDDKYKCPKCDDIFSKFGLISHYYRKHDERGIKFLEDRYKNSKKLNKIKLTKDEISKRISEGLKKCHSEGRHPGWSHINTDKNRRSYPEKYFIEVFENNNLYNRFKIEEKYPFGKYFLDFLFLDINLVIEIDGIQHYRDIEAIEHDRVRDEFLVENGFKVYRINWSNVCNNPTNEINEMMKFIENIKNVSNRRIVINKNRIECKDKCLCGNLIKTKGFKNCNDCRVLNNRKVKERPNLEELKKCISEFGYVKTGKKYGVSDNCIRKWLKKYMEE